MRALVLVACAGCFGTLGQPGHRAPPGLAFCEPNAVRVDWLDPRGGDVVTVTARCRVGGEVRISMGGELVRILDAEQGAALWKTIEAAGPLAPCAPSLGLRFRIRIAGDDDDQVAVCPLGGDVRFDQVLGAVWNARRAPEPAPPPAIDDLVSLGQELEVDVGGRAVGAKCDGAPPFAWIRSPNDPVARAAIDARTCRSVYASVALAVTTASCQRPRGPTRTCLMATDRLHARSECCDRGANPRFDLAVGDVRALFARVSAPRPAL